MEWGERKWREEEEEGKEKGRKGINMGFSLPKANFLVTSLLMFTFINNEMEAVVAYIKKVSEM